MSEDKGFPLTLTDLQKLKLQARMYLEEDLKNALSNDCTEMLFQELKHKTGKDKENHMVIFCYGEQGLGKTKALIGLMKKIDPNVKAVNIGFSTQNVLDNLPNLKKGSVALRDETYQEFGTGSMRIKENFGMAIETLRKAGISFLIAKPEFERIEGVHWVIEVLARNDKERKTWCALKEPKTLWCVGGLLLDAEPDTDPLWIEYSKRKDEFIESVKNQDFGKYNITDKSEEVLKKLLEEDAELKNWKRKNEREIYVRNYFAGYTTGEVKNIHIEMERLIRIRNLLHKDNKPSCPECDSTFVRFLIKENMMLCQTCGMKWAKR